MLSAIAGTDAKTANWSGTDNQWKMNVTGHYFLWSELALDASVK